MKIGKAVFFFASAAIIALAIWSLNSCGANCEFIGIAADSLPTAKVGERYEARLYLDLTCSYTFKRFKIAEGALPEGLEMDGSGLVSGTPTKAGVFFFTVEARACFGTGTTGATDCSDKRKELSITVEE